MGGKREKEISERFERRDEEERKRWKRSEKGERSRQTHLVTPLLRVIGIPPGLPDVEKRKVISPGLNEVLVSGLSVNLLVLRDVVERT